LDGIRRYYTHYGTFNPGLHLGEGEPCRVLGNGGVVQAKDWPFQAESSETRIAKVIKMFVLEKTPAEALTSGRVTYPFQEMEPGDSFFINNYRKAESARIAAFQFCKRNANSWKFTMRKMDGGWRLIRIN